MVLDFEGMAQLVTAIGVLIIGIMSTWNNMRIGRISDKTIAIEAHVNSEKTADTMRIRYLERENALKQHMLEEKDRVAGLLAQSLALKNATDRSAMGGRIGDVTTEVIGKVLEPKLDEIAANTKAIDVNTQKVVEKIDEVRGVA